MKKMATRILALVVLGALSLSSSCQDQAESLDQPTDAVDLFESVQSLRLSDEPLLVVGADDSLPLHRVKDAVFFGEGIAVAEGGTQHILIVDSTGQLVSRQGGEGYGPGEYRNLAGVARFGDGLITWDAYHWRLTRLDSHGAYVGGTRQRITPPSYYATNLVGAFGEHVLLRFDPVGFRGSNAVEPLEVRQEVEFIIANAFEGNVLASASFPGMEEWAARDGTVHGALPVTFGRTVASAVTARGAVIGDTDALAFEVFNDSGERDNVSLGKYEFAVDVSEEWIGVVEDTIRAATETFTYPFVREFRQVLVEDLPARTTLPAFSKAVGGRDGVLWVREYPNPTQTYVTWVALDDAFAPIAHLSIPISAQVLDFAEDRILTLSQGALGEELLLVHAMKGAEVGQVGRADQRRTSDN